jgi:hypothetical protein
MLVTVATHQGLPIRNSGSMRKGRNSVAGVPSIRGQVTGEGAKDRAPKVYTSVAEDGPVRRGGERHE